MAELIAFGGILGMTRTGIRSSVRIRAQPDADSTQLERAIRITQLRDSPSTSGIKSKPKFSILSFSDAEIVDRDGKLGVSLGSSPSKVLDSVKSIKVLEEDRTLCFLQNNISQVDDGPQCLFVSKVSGLCEDLTAEEIRGMDDHTDQTFQSVKAIRQRKKKQLDFSKVRRSSRIKVQKSYC
jgi:hypothetical protein